MEDRRKIAKYSDLRHARKNVDLNFTAAPIASDASVIDSYLCRILLKLYQKESTRTFRVSIAVHETDPENANADNGCFANCDELSGSKIPPL